MSRLFSIALCACISAGTTGCGMLSALTNPKAMWALGEPAQMSLVIRRAEVAQATAREVQRLLGETSVDGKSRWVLKTAMKKADAEAMLKQLRGDPMYADVPQGKTLRAVVAEARLSSLGALCPHESKFPSLFATLGPEVDAAHDEIARQEQTLGELKASLAEAEKALEAKDLDVPAKADLQAKRAKVEEEIAATKASYQPKVSAFLKQVRESAANAPAGKPVGGVDVAVALVSLKRAVMDAKLANSVALIRYPLAVTTLPVDLQTTAKRIIADIVEEKTGHRPIMTSFQPNVTLDGGDVKLSINGIPAEQLGSLSPVAMVTEATTRLVAYVARAVTLPVYASDTQDLLSFESDVLDAWMDGMKLDQAKVTAAGDELADLKVEFEAVKPGAPKPAPRRTAGPRTPGGLGPVACPGGRAAASKKAGAGKRAK